MKKLIIILLLVPFQLFAHHYYVKTAGNNANTGLSDAQAWATIAKVNGFTFAAGDTISFNKGDTWRETLTCPRSGSAANYMIFNSYGTGNKPKILGSNISASWIDQGSNIWKSTTTFTNPNSALSSIFFYNATDSVAWGIYKANTGLLTAQYHWTWATNYIYVYSTSDPGTLYNSIEIPQRAYGINIGNTNEYIELDSLDIRHANTINVYDSDPNTSLSGFTIKNCHLGWVGNRELGEGYNLAVCRNYLTIQDNEIHEGGRRQISVHVYDANGLTFKHFLIEGNTCHDGYHGSGFGIAMDGSNNNNHFQDIIIRNNLFYDRTSRDADVDGLGGQTSLGALRVLETGGTIRNVQVYDNIFKNTVSYALTIEKCDSVVVYNNTFYDFNLNTTTVYLYHILAGPFTTGFVIKNNIFYGTQNYALTHKDKCIVFQNGLNLTQVTLDYNLFYQVNASMPIIEVEATGTNYNRSNWATFKAAYPTWQVHDPGTVDPLFVSSSDLHLQAGSPAIGAGIGVGINLDYEGNPWNATPSVGAYEYGSAPLPPPNLKTVLTFSAQSLNSITGTVTGGWIESDNDGTATAAGVCLSTSVNPTISDIIYSAPYEDAGMFDITLTELGSGITYHVRYYVTNETGTAYGEDKSFTTPAFSYGESESKKIISRSGKYVTIP